uniref:Esculentin-1SEb n=1 Tax=Lithobates sevosus TaxID=299683 RepID=ES1SB_LITSE|nr:RecName: Full=Esculentin-1SEb [Lithobates sevosus]
GLFSKFNKKKIKSGLFKIIKTAGKEAGLEALRTGIDVIGCKIKGEC